MEDNTNMLIGNNLRRERWVRDWSQAFVARQLDISIRTLSRAETGHGISKGILKKLCGLYQITMADLYDEKLVIHKQISNQNQVDLVPEKVAVGLLIKNSFISDLQRETICRYNDRIKKDAVMNRKDVEEFLCEIVGEKKQYSLSDMIGCCMAVNQRTLYNITKIALL
jgi:transcriptional regulator with XRE-family HTH domain